MAAARAWATGTLVADTKPIEAEAVADARRFGASAAELDGLRQHLSITPALASVWGGNVTTVLAFLCAATQWRTGLDMADGRLRTIWIGLDYASARVSIAESGIAITPALWTGLRVMENAALAALNGVVP